MLLRWPVFVSDPYINNHYHKTSLIIITINNYYCYCYYYNCCRCCRLRFLLLGLLVLRPSISSLLHSATSVIAAGHQPGADNILERFESFGSMVQWFNQQVLSCRACFSLGSNPPFCFVLV